MDRAGFEPATPAV